MRRSPSSPRSGPTRRTFIGGCEACSFGVLPRESAPRHQGCARGTAGFRLRTAADLSDTMAKQQSSREDRMTVRLSHSKGFWLAATLAGALGASSAAAQQSTPTPPPPTPNQPKADAATRLRGINPPPFPMAADQLPVPQLKLPKGFKVEVFVSGVPNARSLRLGDKGTVFVSHRLLEKIEDNLDNPPKPSVIYDQFPNHQSHGWKFIAVGPDNKLYINVGAPCNICLPPETNSQIRRINLDGSGSETYVRGVRNSVGFDFHPVTKELYFTDNGRDWLSEELPNDELNRVTKAGQHFGYPYCHQGNIPDDQFGWGRPCSEFEPPVALLGPHSAALGMRFYTGQMFPAEYRNAIFVARHGSWNKTNKIGGDIIVVKLNPNGSVRSWEPFMTGFLKDNNYIGRPVDVEVMKDGALLVSDDYAGAIYRISYDGRRVAER